MSTLSRREFVQLAGAGFVASNLAWAREGQIPAGEVVNRIKENLGMPWDYSTYRDTFKIGGPDSMVTGVASSFGSNLRVLQLANAAGLNMVITHEPTFYSDGDRIDLVEDDPLYKMKRQWAELNNIVVWRIHDHWHRRDPDGIRIGWNRGMGWEQHLVDDSLRQFEIPETTLGELAREVARKLDSKSVRVVGDPSIRVSRVRSGGRSVGEIMSLLPDFDCLISSDNREYDTYEYMRDVVLSDAKKGAIFISHASGEDLGMEEFARWLKPLVPEVRVEWVPTTDEFWTV
jgi:putative NIF3 family GTP cyclohydrolase 1 type 2